MSVAQEERGSLVNNSRKSHADFQVLPALNAEEAAKLCTTMHGRGYEHYQTLPGHWSTEDEYRYSPYGMTLFFRKHVLPDQGTGRAGHRGARPEGARK